MKYILTLLLTGTVVTTFSQTVDYSLLAGTWLCYKATEGTTDVTDDYKDCETTFKNDSTYIEERRYCHSTIEGIYTLDKKNKKISFKNLVSTTSFPDAKIKMNDLIEEINMQDEIIFSLDKNSLVILLKKLPDSELGGDNKLYYRRQK